MGVPSILFESVNLASVDAVKALVPIETDQTAQDSAIAALIPGVSARITNAMRRHTKAGTRTETYEISPNRSALTLRGSPITSVSSVKLSETTDFTSSVPLTSGTDYFYKALAGVICFRTALTASRTGPTARPIFPAFVEVTWSGGYGADEVVIANSYPEIAIACAAQVAYLLQRSGKGAIGARTVQASADAKVGYEDAYDLLPEVKAVIASHHRRTW